MKTKIVSLLCFILSSVIGRASVGSVEVFPQREILPGREEIQVAITNPSHFDIFCAYIHSPVIYRSRTTENNIDEDLLLTNIWIPKNFALYLKAGKEKTRALRESGFYPDASIDVANNEYLASYTDCSYRMIPREEKRQYLRRLGSFDEIRRQMPIYQSQFFHDTTTQSIYYVITITGDTMLIEKRLTAVDSQEALEATDFLITKSGDISTRAGFNANISTLKFKEHKIGTQENIKILETLLHAFRSDGPLLPKGNEELQDLSFGLIDKIFYKSLLINNRQIPGIFRIQSEDSTKCLSVRKSSDRSIDANKDTFAFQWDCNEKKPYRFHNLWRIDFNPDNSVKISSIASGLCLSHSSETSIDGRHVIKEDECSRAGSFYIYQNSITSNMIKLADTNLCLSVRQENGISENGSLFLMDRCDSRAGFNQQFFFQKILQSNNNPSLYPELERERERG